jgi:hypothetical protein
MRKIIGTLLVGVIIYSCNNPQPEPTEPLVNVEIQLIDTLPPQKEGYKIISVSDWDCVSKGKQPNECMSYYYEKENE